MLRSKEIEVEPGKHETPGPGNSHTYELPYDNDLDQDQLNRRMRKPGEPGYRPPEQGKKPTISQGDSGEGPAGAEPRKP
jgi:hypothetical protein